MRTFQKGLHFGRTNERMDCHFFFFFSIPDRLRTGQKSTPSHESQRKLSSFSNLIENGILPSVRNALVASTKLQKERIVERIECSIQKLMVFDCNSASTQNI